MYEGDMKLPTDRNRGAFVADAAYLKSAKTEATRLIEKCGLSPGQSVLDIGCGYGKLATGIILLDLDVHYTGIDVRQDAIAWCQNNIVSFFDATLDFEHIDVCNERYNPQGKPIDSRTFSFSYDDQCFDVIYAFSVLSHMRELDAELYLREIARVLKPDGIAFLTAFVRYSGANFEVNPDIFDMTRSINPTLHYCVYKQSYFESLLMDCGLVKHRRRRKLPQSTQSAYYLRRA